MDFEASFNSEGLTVPLSLTTTYPGAVCYLTESMHGAGSPQAQKIMIGRLADIR